MTAKEKANAFYKMFAKVKKYNSFSLMYGKIEFVWNDGMGSLQSIRFFDDNTVRLNMCLVKKADKDRVIAFFQKHNLGEPAFEEAELGYPEYYSRGL